MRRRAPLGRLKWGGEVQRRRVQSGMVRPLQPTRDVVYIAQKPRRPKVRWLDDDDRELGPNYCAHGLDERGGVGAGRRSVHVGPLGDKQRGRDAGMCMCMYDYVCMSAAGSPTARGASWVGLPWYTLYTHAPAIDSEHASRHERDPFGQTQLQAAAEKVGGESARSDPARAIPPLARPPACRRSPGS
jgi:hypothetical protein